MKCTEVIARVLQAEGVELMTCFPLNPIIDAVAALNIRPLVTRQNGWRSISPTPTAG